MISTPTEKVSEFLDHQLQPIMKQGNSYVKDTGDFLEKLRAIGEIPKGAILVTADVVRLYASIPHNEGLKVLRNQYDKSIDKTITTEDIIKMAEFFLKNNSIEFNSKFHKQISGTAIGTKFAPPYACIFVDFIETVLLKFQEIKPWLWKRFIDDIFFIWTKIQRKILIGFWKILTNFTPTLDLPMKSREKKLISWM